MAETPDPSQLDPTQSQAVPEGYGEGTFPGGDENVDIAPAGGTDD
jgi:hypothetical protein